MCKNAKHTVEITVTTVGASEIDRLMRKPLSTIVILFYISMLCLFCIVCGKDVSILDSICMGVFALVTAIVGGVLLKNFLRRVRNVESGPEK